MLAAIAWLPHVATAESQNPLYEDYRQLQEWSFSQASVMVPAEGLHWRVDTAEWHLDRGEIWLMRPTHDGQVTGLVFRGSGRFTMEIPDPVELRQLRRFADDPSLTQVEETFDSLVIRMLGFPLLDTLGEPPASTYSKNALARDRHQHWLTLRGLDTDARVVAAIARPGDRYLLVDMHTDKRDWLTWEFDAQRTEEIALTWFNSSFSTLESWVSLDRAEDRAPSGRPSFVPPGDAEVAHVDITVDLTRDARESPRGMAKIRPTRGRFEAQVDLEGIAPGDAAIQLYLSAWAEVLDVRDESGRELAFLRDHLGGRSSALDKKIYDSSLVVLLASPTAADRDIGLVVVYEMEVDGYLPGRSWYPSVETPGTGLYDRHTARLVLTTRDEFDLRAMGSLLDEGIGDGRRTWIWQIDRPVKMMSFVFAKRSHEESFEFAGLPQVAAFSSLGGFLTENRVHQVAADVVNSLNFFQELLQSEIPGDRLQAALIPSSHGQAFDGLLHIGDFSVGTDNVAAVELFRAHEVAHEWWGHRVGWASYRDQWLSEGFAEYSAMMFVEANVEGGPKYFRQMLEAISDELTGSLASSFSQFSRPGVSLLNMRALDRIGPIGHGVRCTVGEARTAYLSQIYKKGAYVLHMLRVLLRHKTGSDDAFVELLREFVERYTGAYPSTADFESLLTELQPADWSWFFDQWVYGAEIPTYLWSYEVERGGEGYRLRLRVEQQEVSPGFRMAVPILVRLAGGREGTLVAFVDQSSNEFEFPLPGKPKKVVFNPDHAVLGRVRKN